MKKATSLLVVLVATFCFATNVFAATPPVLAVSEEIVSIDEYEEALQNAYAEHGIVVKVLEYDLDIVLTRAMLDAALNEVVSFVDSIEITAGNPYVVSESADNNSVLRAMPVTKTLFQNFTISNKYGVANMTTSVTGTVDVQISNMMSVSSYHTYQSGQAINLDSVSTTSSHYVLNAPSGGWVRIAWQGTATFSYTEPTTGVKLSYTSFPINISEFHFG